MRDFTDIPKPLVEVGNRPILIHLMEIFARAGFHDFIICLGYRGDVIKQYFLERKWRTSDFTLEDGKIKYHEEKRTNWKLTFVDTGEKVYKGRETAQDFKADYEG